MSLLPAYSLDRVAIWDQRWCTRFNRMSRWAVIRWSLRAASRLGDGLFWYLLMLVLLVRFGRDALPAVLHMIGVGLVCTLLYKWLKTQTSRLRPYERHAEIVLAAAPIDRFSFPSGHMLHATAFALVAVSYYPSLVWLVLPFALLVALSRVVLGLHYPSDVLAGAALGAIISGISLGV